MFDQGEPGSSRGEITGDSFAIELFGGAYAAYTRGGYIEGGNVQSEGFEVADGPVTRRRARSSEPQPMITSTEGFDVMPESGSRREAGNDPVAPSSTKAVNWPVRSVLVGIGKG